MRGSAAARAGGKGGRKKVGGGGGLARDGEKGRREYISELEGGRGHFLFFFSLCATKAVRANNERGEWCVSREALSRVS